MILIVQKVLESELPLNMISVEFENNTKGGSGMLKKLRQERGLTHEQLAKKLGFSKSYYVKIENDFMNPSYKVLKKLKDFYGEDINLNELFK